MQEGTYLQFVSTPSGYELREQTGEPPQIGSIVEADGAPMRVAKLASSPLPNDARTCVYLVAS